MLRHTDKFDASLSEISKSLLAPLSEQPRDWLLGRALDELVSDLTALDAAAENMVSGAPRPDIVEPVDSAAPTIVDGSLLVSGQQVMQTWEKPLMKAMAEQVAGPGRSVLEIGFGLGISAGYIQEYRPARHTIVEANPQVFETAVAWSREPGHENTEIVFGRWQEVIDSLGRFDGIFFDTYPLDENEFASHFLGGSTYAEHFFPAAAGHLTEGGSFTYYSNEIDSLSRRHQRSLLHYFRTIRMRVVDGLRPPPDCSYWWAPSMVVVTASESRY
ncbi:class I SAM-dependent methyltransferase [Frankia sp. CiP1_Cm_nod1]|uniref:class I SAM-dependent methyltransferase n=1 Tax=Frankia sp. CiP1_Cm_nod1 TaxID=2897160 RepID=UPI0020242994